MPELGKKYTCYSCHTKFYDLGKPVPTCPKCGADQRDADEAPVYTAPRSRRVVEEPAEEEEFTPAAASGEAADEEGDDFVAADDEREEEADDEEEEY
ncbi:MAG TPA: FYDLN acid domain-containing protein [Thermoanaerobaculia bacterium]